MKRLQAYKFELKPNGEQTLKMRQFAGCCRFVSNKALAFQQAQYAADNRSKFSYVALANLLPSWKQENNWLADAPSQALQQALKNLERAYMNFFEKRADFPRYKKRGQQDSFRYPQGFTLDNANGRIKLPKLGWVRYRKSRDVLGVVRNVTISFSAGKWFVSIQTAREVEQPLPNSTGAVGIDVGIARLATLSDGSVIEPINSYQQHQHRLARYQRAMSRKVKFSSNWKKAKARLQKYHTRIAHIRRDYLHKATTTISKNHAMVCIEDLQVSNMSRSAKGNKEAPGKNVRAKAGLNRSILDQGWGEFRRQLEYKLTWQGGQLVAVNPRNTSRTCPSCGCVSAENRQTQARFACVECGFEENADLVGAINILALGHLKAAGHAVLACGGTVQSGRPVKQEPTEVTRLELAHA